MSKLTPAVHEAIVNSVRAGNYLAAAARAAGVSDNTARKWLRRGEGTDDREQAPEFAVFAAAVRHAEAEAEDHAVAALNDAMLVDWRAAEAFLKRRFPDRRGDRAALEHSGGLGLAIEQLLNPDPLAATHSDIPEDE